MNSSERKTVAYNTIITGLVENEQVQKAYEMFQLMCQQGLVPNRFSLVALLGNCSNPNGFRVGMELHCLAVKLKLDSIAVVGNVLITMYSKVNLIEDAEKIFWSIEEKYMISWNTFIVVCSHALDHAKGLSVFIKMIKTHSLTPDDFIYTSAKSTNHSTKLQLSFSVKI
ncbi:putative tetratricopeptide-like helical domain superfamily [Helianthus debilis subsp. tardiflorus]